MNKLSKVGQKFTNKIASRNRRIQEHQNKIERIADRPGFTSVNQADKALLKNQQNWINSFGMSETDILKSNIVIPYVKTAKKKLGKKNQPRTQNIIGDGLTDTEMYNRSYTQSGYLDLGY